MTGEHKHQPDLKFERSKFALNLISFIFIAHKHVLYNLLTIQNFLWMEHLTSQIIWCVIASKFCLFFLPTDHKIDNFCGHILLLNTFNGIKPVHSTFQTNQTSKIRLSTPPFTSWQFSRAFSCQSNLWPVRDISLSTKNYEFLLSRFISRKWSFL